MNAPRFLLCLFLALVLLSGYAFPQKKSDLTPVATDASLADTQKWLIKAIAGNSAFTYKTGENKITDLKFDGCQFSYVFVIKPKSDPVLDSQIDRTKPVSPMGTPANYMNYLFDLKDIDPVNISFKPLQADKLMQQMFFKTLSGKETISTGYRHGTLRDTGHSSGASIIITEKASEMIKAGFVQAVQLCQAPDK